MNFGGIECGQSVPLLHLLSLLYSASFLVECIAMEHPVSDGVWGSGFDCDGGCTVHRGRELAANMIIW